MPNELIHKYSISIGRERQGKVGGGGGGVKFGGGTERLSQTPVTKFTC